jgi:hypothetical protein
LSDWEILGGRGAEGNGEEDGREKKIMDFVEEGEGEDLPRVLPSFLSLSMERRGEERGVDE